MDHHLLLFATTTGYQTRMFADAARRAGVRFTLATDRCDKFEDPWGDGALPVRFEQPLESLATLTGAGPFTAVAAVGDRTTFLAALYAERAGIPFHPPAAIEAAANKYLAKERFRAAGLPQPRYSRHPVDSGPEGIVPPFPCVLKPLALSGSRGVIRANDPVEFAAAFRRIVALLSEAEIRRTGNESAGFIQVESFIPGREYAIEGLVTAGEFRALALFDKPDPLDGPYFEETIYVTPSRLPAEVQRQVIDTIGRGAAALGLTNGPIHAEARVNSGGVYVLEIAGRPIGGLCAKALEFDGGLTLEELILRHALGQDVSGFHRVADGSAVLMIPIPKAGAYKGVQGLDEARQVPHVREIIISAKEGQVLKTYPEADSYLGFIFARAPEPGMAEQAVRDAHNLLRFDIATELMTARC